MQNKNILVVTYSDKNDLKQINQVIEVGNCLSDTINVKNSLKDICNSGTKAKRKTRSTRRRLNAMMSNASFHFSDTDSEGELTTTRTITHNPKICSKPSDRSLLRPIISITPDHSVDGSCTEGERRNSFFDNLTDVDEICTSEPEDAYDKSKVCTSLTVIDKPLQAETDLEEISNDEEEFLLPILIKPRGDIFCEFNGETITTKEGYGPFSVETRNQMSIDESNKSFSNTPDIVVMPTTDSEDIEASDVDEEFEGACGPNVREFNVDALTSAQVFLKNVDKIEQQLLIVKDPDDGINDCLTDIEDIE